MWPSIVAVDDVDRLPDGHVNHRRTCRLGPLRLRGVSEDLEVVANRTVISRTRNGIESRWTWLWSPEDGSTRVTVEFVGHVRLPVTGVA